ncbi:hypothetical protein D3C80_1916220 [compost metagenome]
MNDDFVQQIRHPRQPLRGDLKLLVALLDEAIVLEFLTGEVEQNALGRLIAHGVRRSSPGFWVVLTDGNCPDGYGLAELCDHLQSHHGHFVVEGHGGSVCMGQVGRLVSSPQEHGLWNRKSQ